MKRHKETGKSAIAPTKYTQFIKVRIYRRGSITACEATTEDGVTENFIWSRKSHRQQVHANAAHKVDITIDDGVPADHGWDWDYKY